MGGLQEELGEEQLHLLNFINAVFAFQYHLDVVLLIDALYETRGLVPGPGEPQALLLLHQHFFGSILLLGLGVLYLAQVRGLLGLVELLGVFDQIDDLLDGFQDEQLDQKNAVDNDDESQKNGRGDDGDPVVLLDQLRGHRVEGVLVDDLTLEGVLDDAHDHIDVVDPANVKGIRVLGFAAPFELQALREQIELLAGVVENRLLDHRVEHVLDQNLQDRFGPLEFGIRVDALTRGMVLQIVRTIFIQNKQIVVRNGNNSIKLIVKHLAVGRVFDVRHLPDLARFLNSFYLSQVLLLKFHVSFLGVDIFQCVQDVNVIVADVAEQEVSLTTYLLFILRFKDCNVIGAYGVTFN